LITPPAAEPVPLSDVKADLRIDHDDDNAKLERYLAEAREWVERRTGHEVAEKTWELVIDYFPDDEMRLPRRPVLGIESIKYDDESGVEQTLAEADYFLDSASDEAAWVFPTEAWPTVLDAVNSVRVQFRTGYDDPALVPAPLKSAIRLRVQELYDGADNARGIDATLTNYYTMVA
jgi:uncharacterized phiE125 gp8 family phage protein